MYLRLVFCKYLLDKAEVLKFKYNIDFIIWKNRF